MLPTGATTRIGTSLTSAGLLLGGTAVVAETGSNEDMNIWRISGTHIVRKKNNFSPFRQRTCRNIFDGKHFTLTNTHSDVTVTGKGKPDRETLEKKSMKKL